MSKSFRAAALGTLIFLATPLWAKEFPLFLKIYDFSVSSRWDTAQVTTLKIERSDPLYVGPEGTLHNHFSFRTLSQNTYGKWEINDSNFSPGNLYLDLQRLSLIEMLRAGYINREMYDSVVEATHTWEPSQVRYAVLYSEMSLEEARTIFSENIPWDRVSREGSWLTSDKPDANWHPDRVSEHGQNWPPNTPLQIVRASALLGLGQTLDWRANKLRAVDLAWQKRIREMDPEWAEIDRAIFPFTAEVSRGVSFGGPLSGSELIPVLALVDGYSQMVKIFDGSFDGAAIFALSLKPDRGRYFNRAFDMDYWNAPLQQRLSENPLTALLEFNERIFPSSSDRRVLHESGPIVNVTTLKRFEEHVPTHMRMSELSALARTGSEITRGALSSNDVNAAFRLVPDSTFQYYQFPAQEEPLCVWDGSLAIPAARLTTQLTQRCPNFSPKDNESFFDWLSSELTVNELNMWLPFWREHGMILPTDGAVAAKAQGPKYTSIRISNFTEAAVREHPEIVRSAILTVYEAFRTEIMGMENLALGQIYFSALKARGLPIPADGSHVVLNDIDWVFDAFPISIATTHKIVSDEALRIGGDAGTAISLDKPVIDIDFDKLKGPLAHAVERAKHNMKPGDPISLPASVLTDAVQMKLLNTANPAYIIHFRSHALKRLLQTGAPVEMGTCASHLVKQTLLMRAPGFY